MLESVLIANRGEIARRVIRTARLLNIRTIAVYSDVDGELPFVREADDAVHIGPAPARESYLNADRILEVARSTKAQAIHPGYGFLSENAEFAQRVLDAGLIWVGAPPGAIRAMGRKDAAKDLMQKSGVPVTPGYQGADQSADHLRSEADRIGYPVLIKAISGGGGKGMRRVDERSHFSEALASCKREALSSFSDDRVLLEKYISNPRHIEVQVFGDTHGNYVHLFERDCSLQRRHQKVIEEAPAPGMGPATRESLCAIAIKAAQAVSYVGAGTIEFIADATDGLRTDRIWFMEMNTRLQVEHPVTEAITGQDLVEWQFLVAAGERLPLTQRQLAIKGWAMEARLYAENPASGFLPSTGPLHHLKLPENIRTDVGIVTGNSVSAFYDPMIAKLIVHGSSRKNALEKLAAACRSVEAWPIKTNAAFLGNLVSNPDFMSGHVDTGFIAVHLNQLLTEVEPPTEVIEQVAWSLTTRGTGPWETLAGFRAGDALNKVEVTVAGKRRHAYPIDHQFSTWRNCETNVVFYRGQAWPFEAPTYVGPAKFDIGDGAIIAPMPGAVTTLAVSARQSVKRGQMLLVLEAMKMEMSLVAPSDGVIAELNVSLGQQVTEGTVLARVVAEKSS